MDSRKLRRLEMTTKRCKPTVINLREHLPKYKETERGVSRNLEKKTPNIFALKLKAELSSDDRRQSVVTELDDEMKNDFRWLINFDLKSVFLYDIERNNPFVKYPNNSKSIAPRVCSKDPFACKVLRNKIKDGTEISKRSLLLPCIELIESCLNEVGAVRMKVIYNWIRTRIPALKPTDTKWKNAIRNTLKLNPQFRKIDGKYYLQRQVESEEVMNHHSHKQFKQQWTSQTIGENIHFSSIPDYEKGNTIGNSCIRNQHSNSRTIQSLKESAVMKQITKEEAENISVMDISTSRPTYVSNSTSYLLAMNITKVSTENEHANCYQENWSATSGMNF
ncbi:uncharacterized protein LOC118195637 [Stegodyphus dumicola]|uniref:uncharacterized protein LOC118195637 n=1 Tax=Stegodyphus dumicola TaxID=202533 RepID=UPI0015AEB020|nr:uncharacterized protein LOC118195637 [Stegodyphus dumicola]